MKCLRHIRPPISGLFGPCHQRTAVQNVVIVVARLEHRIIKPYAIVWIKLKATLQSHRVCAVQQYIYICSKYP
jgi:hypothetical protein